MFVSLYRDVTVRGTAGTLLFERAGATFVLLRLVLG